MGAVTSPLSGVGILKASEQRREQKEKKHENI